MIELIGDRIGLVDLVGRIVKGQVRRIGGGNIRVREPRFDDALRGPHTEEVCLIVPDGLDVGVTLDFHRLETFGLPAILLRVGRSFLVDRIDSFQQRSARKKVEALDVKGQAQ